jgi:hypothetical protein
MDAWSLGKCGEGKPEIDYITLAGAFENRQGMRIGEPDMIELNSAANSARATWWNSRIPCAERSGMRNVWSIKPRGGIPAPSRGQGGIPPMMERHIYC